MQPMSCTDRQCRASSGEIELPAAPDEVWESLPSLLGDDVELAAEPGGRLRADGPRVSGSGVGRRGRRAAPARVLVGPGRRRRRPVVRRGRARPAIAVGTLLRVRETRFDGAHACVDGLLARSACPRTRLTASSPRSSDPTRCRVVERLGLAPATAGEIAGAAAGVAPGGREAPRGARGGRPGRGHAGGPARRVPAHARRVRGRGPLDGRRRRGVGPPARRPRRPVSSSLTPEPVPGRYGAGAVSSGGRHGLQGRRRLRQV